MLRVSKYYDQDCSIDVKLLEFENITKPEEYKTKQKLLAYCLIFFNLHEQTVSKTTSTSMQSKSFKYGHR